MICPLTTYLQSSTPLPMLIADTTLLFTLIVMVLLANGTVRGCAAPLVLTKVDCWPALVGREKGDESRAERCPPDMIPIKRASSTIAIANRLASSMRNPCPERILPTGMSLVGNDPSAR